MTTLYLARHGQTLWNREHRLQGWHDSPLSDLGLQEAAALRERLRNVHLDAIDSSPLGRALRTAEIARGDRDLAIHPHNGLREIKLGVWEGMVAETARATHPEAFERFWKAPHLYQPVDGGETFQEVQERVVSTLSAIAHARPEQTLLVVTHTIALKVALAYFENRPIAEIWDLPPIRSASLSIVALEGQSAKVLLQGDDSYLPEA
jgi:probable phosphoglycerate mutase